MLSILLTLFALPAHAVEPVPCYTLAQRVLDGFKMEDTVRANLDRLMARIKTADGRAFSVVPSDGTAPFGGHFVLNSNGRPLVSANRTAVVMFDDSGNLREIPLRDLNDPKAFPGEVSSGTAKKASGTIDTNAKPLKQHPVESAKVQLDTTLFEDGEIVAMHDSKPVGTLANGDRPKMTISKSESGRTLVHQLTPEDNGAAVSAMLMIDRGAKPEAISLLEYQGTGLERVKADLKRVGLHPKPFQAMGSDSEMTDKLSELIDSGGPTAVVIQGPGGGRRSLIIVDSIDTNAKSARIRDPKQGWDITITLEALQKRLAGKLDALQPLFFLRN